jgi:tetratricopeptide (TPR) repeat protein
VGQKFYDLAYELAHSKHPAARRIEQARVFASASMELGSNIKDAQKLLLELAVMSSGPNNFEAVRSLLISYVDESADVDLAKRAVLYLLGHPNTTQRKEDLLEQLLGTIGGRNVVLDSELTELMGRIKLEKGDVESAEFYLMQAYKKNRYNETAFSKLMEIKPERVGPTIYLERLRLKLRENPTDIGAALALAEQAEKLQLYDTAAGVYEYSANLFNYLYPSEVLPSRIYLPWAVSSYNSREHQAKCLEIAQQIQEEGRFDLRLEALAAKIITKMGDGDVATQIIQDAEEKALSLLSQSSTQPVDGAENPAADEPEQISITQLAWFYCFALPIPDQALHWANKANLAEPNSPTCEALLAYALMMNNQVEWARPLVNAVPGTQIEELTLAQIQLFEGRRDSATETLNSAIAKDPGSFAAERAKELLSQMGQKYRPPVDSDAVLSMLTKVFQENLVPVFKAPEDMFSVRLVIRGDEFPFGSEFSGDVEIANNSAEPLVISDEALFRGNIRIDADISGDINKKIPSVFFDKIRDVLFIEPGGNMVIGVRVFTGELRQILVAHPQASVIIDFTVYADPVGTNRNKVTNRLTNMQPHKVRIERPGLELTGQYLRSQLDLISTDNVKRQTEIARVFVSLLKEQHKMLNRQPLYRLMYAEWMAPLLRKALLQKILLRQDTSDEQWPAKVHTMLEMVSLPLDYELTSAAATNLSSSNWAVRMTALYLLGKAGGSDFDKVLDWAARNDPSRYVRDMAIALGGDIAKR